VKTAKSALFRATNEIRMKQLFDYHRLQSTLTHLAVTRNNNANIIMMIMIIIIIIILIIIIIIIIITSLA